MPQKKQPSQPRINVLFDRDTYNAIMTLAASKNMSASELIRGWSEKCMKGDITAQHADLITEVVAEQLKNILGPFENRVSKLLVKTCIQAATSVLLNAEAINALTDNPQEVVEQLLVDARKQAVKYTKEG